MIIHLKAIPLEGSRSFEFSLNEDWWQSEEPHNGQDIGLQGPVQVRLKIYRAVNKYVVEGSFEGTLRLSCDRCLRIYPEKIKNDFRVIMAPSSPDMKESEVELAEDDMDVGLIRDEEIDAGEIVREQIYLSLPIKSLCRDDCPGLCPVCGIDLSEKTCQCNKTQGHPGFQKLKKLTVKGE
ncbi:MAG TPA: DUF177 domain-containing protein [Desulfobacteraceae bacterium]|mgnify:CR=1 FL=1|nr:DUF177 domain-containing protein [Desulfobacteraceae bacterium]